MININNGDLLDTKKNRGFVVVIGATRSTKVQYWDQGHYIRVPLAGGGCGGWKENSGIFLCVCLDCCGGSLFQSHLEIRIARIKIKAVKGVTKSTQQIMRSAALAGPTPAYCT